MRLLCLRYALAARAVRLGRLSGCAVGSHRVRAHGVVMDRTTPPRRRIRTAVIAGSSALALVVGGGSWWALDRFVIPHVEIASATAYEAENSTVESVSTEDSNAVATATSYDSDYADITISTVTTGSGDDTVTYYVADVVLGDATALRSAFAEDTFGENITETTSEIAAANDAIFAINGDYYGFRDTGIVIRNGVIYRDEGARDGLAFFLDGSVEVYDETSTSAEQLLADGVWNTLSFGPALIDDGEILEGIDEVEVDTNIGNHSIQGDQPRTAVGVIAPHQGQRNEPK